MTGLALQSDNITKLAVGATVGVVVLGLLLCLVLTAVISRIVILAIVIVLAAFVWQQRDHIDNRVNKNDCNLSATFFGVHVQAPKDVVAACQQHVK